MSDLGRWSWTPFTIEVRAVVYAREKPSARGGPNHDTGVTMHNLRERLTLEVQALSPPWIALGLAATAALERSALPSGRRHDAASMPVVASVGLIQLKGKRPPTTAPKIACDTTTMSGVVNP